MPPRHFELLVVRLRCDTKRRPDHKSHRRKRLGNLCLVPAVDGPMTIGFEVEREHRMTGRLRQPHGAGLRHACGTAWAVERESRRLPRLYLVLHLDERFGAAPRRRTASRAVAEPLDDPRNPLAVKVLARDDDDATMFEVDGRREDAAVPERHDRLMAAEHDLVVMLKPFDAPRERGAERGADAIADHRDRRRLGTLQRRRPPVAHDTRCRSRTNVMRSTNWTSLAGALVCAPLSMIEQNGQAVTTVLAPVAVSCLNRTSLMRLPGSSSLSANSSPPPAPQQ